MTQKKESYKVLELRDFKLYLLAKTLIMLSIQVQSVAIGWQVYQLTKDPLSLGFIGLIEAIPSILVSLYAGHLADNSNRKTILISCLTLFSLCSFALLAFTIDSFQNIIGFSIYHIYIIVFLTGIARGFMSPASFGLLSQIVPREMYSHSAIWNSFAFQIGLVGGPALGGLIYGFFGVTTTYLIDLLLILFAFLSILLIKRQSTPTSEEKKSLFESISEGLKFVFNNQIILGALSLDLFAVLFGGAVALLPVFADEILNVGPKGLGIMKAAPAAGALMMSWMISRRKNSGNDGKELLLSVAAFGICTILFAISTNFYFSILMLALLGMFDNVSVILRSTILQVMTPDTMRGRVSAVNSIFIGSSNEIGAFESGSAAKLLGLVPSVIFGGSMTLLVVIITALKADKLRNLRIKDYISNNK